MASIQSTDLVLVNRNNQAQIIPQAELMSELLDDDLLLVNRGDQTYTVTGAKFKESIGGGEAQGMPKIGTVSLLKTDPAVPPRFTSQDYSVTTAMDLNGNPVPAFASKACVDINGMAYTDLTSAQIESVRVVSYGGDGASNGGEITYRYDTPSTNLWTTEWWSFFDAVNSETATYKFWDDGADSCKWTGSTSEFTVKIYGAGTDDLAADTTWDSLIHLDGWNHFAVVYSANRAKVYVNGRLWKTTKELVKKTDIVSIKTLRIGSTLGSSMYACKRTNNVEKYTDTFLPVPDLTVDENTAWLTAYKTFEAEKFEGYLGMSGEPNQEWDQAKQQINNVLYYQTSYTKFELNYTVLSFEDNRSIPLLPANTELIGSERYTPQFARQGEITKFNNGLGSTYEGNPSKNSFMNRAFNGDPNSSQADNAWEVAGDFTVTFANPLHTTRDMYVFWAKNNSAKSTRIALIDEDGGLHYGSQANGSAAAPDRFYCGGPKTFVGLKVSDSDFLDASDYINIWSFHSDNPYTLPYSDDDCIIDWQQDQPDNQYFSNQGSIQPKDTSIQFVNPLTGGFFYHRINTTVEGYSPYISPAANAVYRTKMPVMGGKWYFEIDGDPASTFAIGMEGFRANYANGYFANTSHSSAGWSFTGKTGGYAGAEFVVTRSNQTFSANANSSTLGIAYDGDTGQFSIRANGAWVDNADPTSTFFAAFVDCKSIGEIYFLAYANGGTTIRTTPRYEVPEGFIFTDGTVNYIYGKTEDGKLLGRGGNFVAGSDVNQPIKQGYGKIQYQDGHECYLYDSNDEWITKENFYDDPMAAKPKEDTVVNISKLWMALDVSGSDVVCRGFLPNDPGYVPVPYKDFTLKFPALFDNGVAPDVLLSSDSSLAVNVQALNKYGGNDVWSNNYLPALEGPAGSMNSIRIDRDRVNEEEEGIDQFMWLKSTEYDQVDNPVVGNGTTVFWFKPTLAGRHYYQGNGFIDTTEDQNDKWLLFYTTNTQYPYYIGNYKTPGANYTASGYFGDYYWFQNNPDIGQFTFPKSTFYELIDNRIAPRPMEAVLSAAESIYWTDKSLALNWKNRTSNGDFIGNDASKNNNNFYTNNFIFTNSLSSYTDKWTPTALSFSAYDGDPTTFSSFRQTMLNPSQGVDTRLAVQNEPSPGGISVNQIRVLMGGTGQTYCEFRFYGNYDGSPGSEAQLIGTAVYDNTGLEQGVLAPAWEEIDCPGAFLTRQELYIDNRNVQEEEAEVSGNIYQIQLDGNTLVQTNVSTDACLDSPYMNIATIPSDEVATVKDCGLTITSGTHNPFYTGDGSSTYYYERDFRKVYAVGKVENLGAGQYNFGQQPWIDGGPGQAGPDDESIVLGTPWAADAGVAYAAYDISDPDHVKEIEATEAKYADYFQQKDARKQRLGAIVGKMKRELTAEEFALLEDNLAPYSVRARNADGTYRGDDPSTPDVDEAWENG